MINGQKKGFGTRRNTETMNQKKNTQTEKVEEHTHIIMPSIDVTNSKEDYTTNKDNVVLSQSMKEGARNDSNRYMHRRRLHRLSTVSVLGYERHDEAQKGYRQQKRAKG